MQSASLLNQEITLPMVQNLLKDQIKETKENIKLPDVINIVANQLNIKPSDIKSKKNSNSCKCKKNRYLSYKRINT